MEKIIKQVEIVKDLLKKIPREVDATDKIGSVNIASCIQRLEWALIDLNAINEVLTRHVESRGKNG